MLTKKNMIGLTVDVVTAKGTYRGVLLEEHKRNFNGCVDLQVNGEKAVFTHGKLKAKFKRGVKVQSIPACNIQKVTPVKGFNY